MLCRVGLSLHGLGAVFLWLVNKSKGGDQQFPHVLCKDHDAGRRTDGLQWRVHGGGFHSHEACHSTALAGGLRIAQTQRSA